MTLAGHRVVLGVSGGVAAYKSAQICRGLGELGAEVRVVMTSTAARFIGPATLAALTGTPPLVDLLDHPQSVSPHTDLARWAEVVLVAPATAASIARIATGMSEDPLSATVLATTAPVVVAPAMHTEMWEHPATQRNVATLVADGVQIVGPEIGPLAGGDEGVGRMSEPETIVQALVDRFAEKTASWGAASLREGAADTVDDSSAQSPSAQSPSAQSPSAQSPSAQSPSAQSMEGVTVLVTAGGTREAIDPVRYIGNRSSGKMGHAVAEVAAQRGAAVTLVTSSSLPTISEGIRRVQVESAAEMDEAVREIDVDVAVMAAAVADFRPADPETSKMSRADGPPQIILEPTPDILAGVVARQDRPFVVGFAAEAGSLDRAVEKARRKGVDVLIANDVTEPDAGFSVDTNRVTVVWPDGRTERWDVAPKATVAARIWDLVTVMRSR